MPKLQKLLRLLTAAVLAVCLSLGAVHFLRENYVFLCGGLHRRDARELDLQGAGLSRLELLDRFPNLRYLDLRSTGLTLEQYEELTALLPDCSILWDVQFQGRFLSPDVQTLTLSRLTREDVDLLDQLPELLYIDARDCEEYALLRELQQRHPDCHIIYSVTLCEKSWDYRETRLTLDSADAATLEERLPYLPQAETVHLTGSLPTMEQLTALQAAFPAIRFIWETEIGDALLTSDTQRLDLSGQTPDPAGLADIFSRYPNLSHVDMRRCGLTDDEMMALADAFPGITFLWEMTVAGVRVSTGAEEIDISGNPVEDIAQIEKLLPYFPNLKKVVMCGCGIDNETMDAVNRKYENIRFVWSVYMGPILLRTDSTYFIPVKWGAEVTTEDLYNLRYCTDMIGVDIGHMDVDSCEWAAYMPNLRYLLMADTPMQDISPLKDLKNLVYLELFMTRVTDLTPLLGCTALEDLNLCYTYADPRPLLEMPWLQNIWWSGGWGLQAYGYQLRQNNPNVHLEYTTGSSTGAGWRELKNYYEMRDLMGMWYMTG